MRHYLGILILSVLSLTAAEALNCVAQNADQTKTARQLKKELYGNTDKSVKKEARNLKKEGWRTMDLPIEMMLQRTWEKEFMTDANGDPRFIYVTTEATARTFAAAQMQCESLAKIRIAANISSSVASLAEISLSNNQIDSETANTLSQASENSKILVSQNLGRLVNTACLYKMNGSNYTVRATYVYDMQKSISLLLESIMKNLPDKEIEQLKSVLETGKVIDQYEKTNPER